MGVGDEEALGITSFLFDQPWSPDFDSKSARLSDADRGEIAWSRRSKPPDGFIEVKSDRLQR